MHGKKLKIGSTMNAINSCTEMNFKNGIMKNLNLMQEMVKALKMT